MGSPAILHAQAERLLPRHNAMMAYLSGHAIGGLVADGGTTQGSGASTAPNFDVDTTAIPESLVNGKVHALGAQTDADATAGNAINWGATSGKEVRGVVVLKTGEDNDTPAIDVVFGDVANTGASVAPTTDDIDTAITNSNWVILASFLLSRTADTTVTIAIDNSARYPAGVLGADRVDLAETEAEFRETSPTVP